MRMLDLFCGRFGWGRAFAARGWEVVGVDLVEPQGVPAGCEFVCADVLEFETDHLGFDFVCASSPCEQFSIHRMRHFHPNPPYPEMGIKLFNYTRAICEASGVPYVMENVYAAQPFVGHAVAHCGPFYLWGNAVPPLMPQGIRKGISMGGDRFTALSREQRRELRKQYKFLRSGPASAERSEITAGAATIPPELSAAVCDYATYLVNSKGELTA